MDKLVLIKGFVAKYAVLGMGVALTAFFIYHIAVVLYYKAQIKLKDTQIVKLETSIGDLRVVNAALVSANTSFAEITKKQSAVVDQLKFDSDEKVEQVKIALSVVRKENHRYKKLYDSIWNITESEYKDPCNALNRHFDTYLEIRNGTAK